MPAQQLELLRRMYRSPSLEEFARDLHPQAEMHQASEIPDTGSYHGRDEFVRGVERWLEEWETFRYIPEELEELPDGRVLMSVRLSGRAKASGIALDQLIFHLWTFRDELPWRCEVFFDEDRARAAAGPGVRSDKSTDKR